LYGPTYRGGAGIYGTLFRLATDGTFTKLYDFTGTDGYYPQAALVAGPDGTLYGSTEFGAQQRRHVVPPPDRRHVYQAP